MSEDKGNGFLNNETHESPEKKRERVTGPFQTGRIFTQPFLDSWFLSENEKPAS